MIKSMQILKKEKLLRSFIYLMYILILIILRVPFGCVEAMCAAVKNGEYQTHLFSKLDNGEATNATHLFRPFKAL
jgi:hypothetical protein